MLNETKIKNWEADEPILILRFSNQTDSWLKRKLDFAHNMFDLAWENQKFDLTDNYKFMEDVFIKTRLYKNSTAKEKTEIKKSLKAKALKRLKNLWQNDYNSFIDTLYGDRDVFLEKYKTDFERFKDEILFYATNHETGEQITGRIKKCKTDDDLQKVLAEYPTFSEK